MMETDITVRLKIGPVRFSYVNVWKPKAISENAPERYGAVLLIPKDDDRLVEKIKKASAFNQGFKTTEALASALVDMKLHLAGNKKIDPDAFEKETLAALGMPKELVMRHRTPQFGHVFSSDGYSAGYYSYTWSDVLTADAFTAFTEAGGPYDKAVADRLVKNVFSVGNTIDPEEAYRNFRGRNPEIDALMKKRGFSIKSKKM